jgi:hypothetical protein
MFEWVSGIPDHLKEWEPNLKWFKLYDAKGAAVAGVLRLYERCWKRTISLGILRSVNMHGILFADAIMRCDADVDELLAGFLRIPAIGRRPWDMVEFEGLREGSPLLRFARLLPLRKIESSTANGVSVISTPNTFDQWQAGLSVSFQADLRKARSRLGRAGTIQCRNSVGPDEVAVALREFVELEASGWKRGQGDLQGDPLGFGMINHALRQSCVNGAGGVFGLYLNARMIAGYIWMRAGSTTYALKTAYAEELARMSPGKVLTAELVRACCEDPTIKKLDFCTRAEWHERFGTAIEPTFTARGFNPSTARGRCAILAHRLAPSLMHRL